MYGVCIRLLAEEVASFLEDPESLFRWSGGSVMTGAHSPTASNFPPDQAKAICSSSSKTAR